LHGAGKVVKSVYVVWLALTGAMVFLTQIFGNPFASSAEYRIEYAGKVGATLWGNYTITEHNKSRDNITEKVIGELPQTVNFTSTNNAIVSANGSTINQDRVDIQIYKNGRACNTPQSDRVVVTNTIVCR
jgi:hypothetical protein